MTYASFSYDKSLRMDHKRYLMAIPTVRRIGSPTSSNPIERAMRVEEASFSTLGMFHKDAHSGP